MECRRFSFPLDLFPTIEESAKSGRRSWSCSSVDHRADKGSWTHKNTKNFEEEMKDSLWMWTTWTLSHVVRVDDAGSKQQRDSRSRTLAALTGCGFDFWLLAERVRATSVSGLLSIQCSRERSVRWFLQQTLWNFEQICLLMQFPSWL